MLIPAGVLIGLGVGLLTGYPGAGVLIGLGLGFIGSALVKTWDIPEPGNEAGPKISRHSVVFALIGAFLVILGIGIAAVPRIIWPCIVAVALILVGIWFLYRNFREHA